MTHAFPTRRSSDLATAGKAVVDGLAMLDDVRDDVAAEIALAVRIVSVAAQFLDQKGRAEDVDAHGRQRHAGAAGNVRRLLRLFEEGGDHVRSEERRVGNAGVSTCRSRWSPDL